MARPYVGAGLAAHPWTATRPGWPIGRFGQNALLR
jgi:hypothetical protein